MRTEDWADVRNEETVLDLTPEQATQLRAEYEADQRAKADARRKERDEWYQQLARARQAHDARGAAELADDVAWARTVIVDGERFRDGLALYLVLYTARKMATGRALSLTETARLRRAVTVLFPDVAEQSAVA